MHYGHLRPETRFRADRQSRRASRDGGSDHQKDEMIATMGDDSFDLARAVVIRAQFEMRE